MKNSQTVLFVPLISKTGKLNGASRILKKVGSYILSRADTGQSQSAEHLPGMHDRTGRMR